MPDKPPPITCARMAQSSAFVEHTIIIPPSRGMGLTERLFQRIAELEAEVVALKRGNG